MLPCPRWIFSAVICWFAGGAALAQTTWFVHGDGRPGGNGSAGSPFGSIQQAIQSARGSGDEILVLPGTYEESLDLGGKEIRIRSSGGPSATVIDGPGSLPSIRLAGGEGEATWIEGFTFSNRQFNFRLAVECDHGSRATFFDCVIRGHRSLPPSQGTAVLLQGTGRLTFRKTLFEDNSTDLNVQNTLGGALLCRSPGTSLTLENCTLRINRARRGAAIAVVDGAELAIHGCRFERNQLATGGGAGLYLQGGARGIVTRSRFFDHGNAGQGGAILVEDADLTVRESHFARNHATLRGGAVAFSQATGLLVDCWFESNFVLFREDPMAGGALSLIRSRVQVRRSRFTDNQARSGGAICLEDSSELSVTDCAFLDNLARVRGGAFHAHESQLQIQSTLLVDNVSSFEGGGIELGENSILRMLHATCEGQLALQAGGSLNVHATATATIQDSILRSSSPEEIRGIATVSYSNVQGGHPGFGNFDLDPLYVDPLVRDFHLSPSSPCIDAGDPLISGTGWRDLEGDPMHGAQVDVGMDEYVPLYHAYLGEPRGGSSMVLSIAGPASAPILFAFSPNLLPQSLPTPFGNFALDFPLLIVPLGSTESTGYWSGALPLPHLDQPLTVHSQVLVGSQLSATRSVTLY